MTPQPSTSLWLLVVAAFVLTAVTMPSLARAWTALGARDDEVLLRKIHAADIPRVGGLVMALVMLALVFAHRAWPWLPPLDLESPSSLPGIFAGAIGMAAVGLVDDLFGLRPRYKLLFQAIAVAIAVYYGVRWEAIERIFDRNLVSLVLTGAFLLAATNAINLVDGLDGLAGGNLATGFLVICLAAALPASVPEPIAWLAAAALGVIGGFLLFNRHPARVFMGDTGAYFLGFLLVALLFEVRPTRPRMWLTHAAITILPLTLPLLDMSLAIARRAVRGQSVFSGDSDHIHHRLLARGFGQNTAVLILYGVSAAFAGLAYLTVVGASGQWTMVCAVVLVGGLCFMLGYHRLLQDQPRAGGSASWVFRRKRMVELRREIERLPAMGDTGVGVERWARVATEMGGLFRQVGVSACEIRVGDRVIARHGEPISGAWLGFSLPGDLDATMRVRLERGLTSLVTLEQHEVLEAVMAALITDPRGRRVRNARSPDARDEDVPSKRADSIQGIEWGTTLAPATQKSGASEVCQ